MEVVDASDPDATEPFATIDEVAEDGPAAAAGVQVGDKLLMFGHVHARNHDGLRALARLTQRSAGETLSLLVLRDALPAPQQVRLSLMPRRWAGQGLLGCHLTPL